METPRLLSRVGHVGEVVRKKDRSPLPCFGLKILAVLAAVACQHPPQDTGESDVKDVGTGTVSSTVDPWRPDWRPDWRPEEEVELDCDWVSQQYPQYCESDERGASNANCGPAGVVISAACLTGFTPVSQDIVDVITWMYEYKLSYGGSYTNAPELAFTMEGFYGIWAQEFSEWSNPASLKDLYGDLQRGIPVLIGTEWQGDNESDEMVSGGNHFMVLVGMTEKEGKWYVVVHDPGPCDEDLGAFHEYTFETFLANWQQQSGVRFLTE